MPDSGLVDINKLMLGLVFADFNEEMPESSFCTYQLR